MSLTNNEVYNNAVTIANVIINTTSIHDDDICQQFTSARLELHELINDLKLQDSSLDLTLLYDALKFMPTDVSVSLVVPNLIDLH